MRKHYYKTNSKSKYRNMKVSPIIPIVAIVEVIILIGVCTYAWFTAKTNKQLLSDTIVVDPDSGLDVDFGKLTDGTIDITQYLNDFTFEPATSQDGRNIYFPTTGTFNSDENEMIKTNSMKFREGTVNDINSKYICVDFALTNTSNQEVPVYLSSDSYFRVYPKGSDTAINGSALRLAFYQNDGSVGNTNSNRTVYFRDDFKYSQKGEPHIFAWVEGGSKNAEYPGLPMTYVATDSNGKKIYSYTFDNNTYANIIFNDGFENASSQSANDAHQTEDIHMSDVLDGKLYTLNGTAHSTSTGYKYYTITQDYSSYSTYVPYNKYDVISPGTSTGFKREYTPVVSIDNSGKVLYTTPAFASSFDDFLYKSSDSQGEYSLFKIQPNKKINLSLIIWLEGTDAGCVAENYANTRIEMLFKFATSTKGFDQLYTYQLLDRTYNTWLRNDGISKTGNTVKPVMQLYDLDNDKGYLMKNSVSDGSVWTCEAPISIASHKLEYRRVNPGDESDVWNFWTAGAVADENGNALYADNALVISNSGNISGTCTYTAFADGRPYWIPDETGNTPDSCGGLWGNYSTSNVTSLTIYDGSKGQEINQTSKDDSQNLLGHALSIGYTYNGQTIEYRDFPHDRNGKSDGFYFYPMPKNILDVTNSNRPEITARRYDNFIVVDANNSMIAITDISRQKFLEFGRSFALGQACGTYCSIYQSRDTSNTNRFYYNDSGYSLWGFDAHYFVTTSSTSGSFGLDDATYYVDYFNHSNHETHYAEYIYQNDAYGEDGHRAFVSIIPSYKNYDCWRVIRASKDSTPGDVRNMDKVYNRTDIQSAIECGTSENWDGWNNNTGWHLGSYNDGNSKMNTSSSRKVGDYYKNSVDNNKVYLEHFYKYFFISKRQISDYSGNFWIQLNHSSGSDYKQGAYVKSIQNSGRWFDVNYIAVNSSYYASYQWYKDKDGQHHAESVRTISLTKSGAWTTLEDNWSFWPDQGQYSGNGFNEKNSIAYSIHNDTSFP